MRTIRLLFFGHLLALVFGLGGLLIALPHPELWADSAFASEVFTFGMKYAGSSYIVLGAATMLVFGGYFIGWRRTLLFFLVTVTLSLSSELIGTGTGWPFGNYAYTGGLGYKVLGRVPYTIPLSWFYIGFASYLLANVLVDRFRTSRHPLWTVALGAYLLTVWDLVLDPAMAQESMPIQFWNWFETGPYFGMPVKNFVGWTVTGLLFMTLSRMLWRGDIRSDEYPVWVPCGVYLANMAFAMALSLSVGLWEPAIAAVLLGCVPVTLAWRVQRGRLTVTHDIRKRREATAAQPRQRIVNQVMTAGARLICRRRLDLHVEGIEHLPDDGPAIIAARHFHHLYDGCILIGIAGRPVHIMVGLDWVQGRPLQRLMELACAQAHWPVVLRPDGLERRGSASVYLQNQVRRYLHQAVRDSVSLLRLGELLVIFPEAYPNIDPTYTPKQGDAFLPFRPGFTRLVEIAQRDGNTRVPIVPVGFAYQRVGGRLQARARFGQPVYLEARADKRQVMQLIEEQVHLLSEPLLLRPDARASDANASFPQEVIQS
jgi:putative membrane protein